jgi:hypothetical protein
MNEYLLMVLENQEAHALEAPKAVANLIAERASFGDGLRRAGKLKDNGRLRPSQEGKRVRRVSERAEVVDGPFVDDGRELGAYYWVEASDADHAAELGLSCPCLPMDTVRVRPIMKGTVATDKDDKPGKIFAIAVLGQASTEQAWVGVMDRIDAETQDCFPNGFLGGVRLLPPTTELSIATDGVRRAMFDGPFIESKEVIGGLCLLRMTHIDEAVRWATETRFVVHGTLEIRELWRS